MKLLLVDDDAFLRDMYALKFRDADFTVEVAETGAQALSILQKDSQFDAILIDMVMSGVTGSELITEIKQQFPDTNARLIVFSNQGQKSDIAEAAQIGADGYIVKAEAVPSQVVAEVTRIVQANNS